MQLRLWFQTRFLKLEFPNDAVVQLGLLSLRDSKLYAIYAEPSGNLLEVLKDATISDLMLLKHM